MSGASQEIVNMYKARIRVLEQALDAANARAEESQRWSCEESGCIHAGTCQAAGRPACFETASPDREETKP